MNIKFIISRILLTFITFVGMVSCTRDIFVESSKISPIPPSEESALVRLEVSVPSNSVPETRALQSPGEDEISEIIVFCFKKGTESEWDTELRHVGRSVGAAQGSGSIRQFTVELYSGEWDLWVVANSESIIENLMKMYDNTDIYSKDFIDLGITKSDLQANVIKTLTGKWPVDPSDAGGDYRIPMWGMLNAVNVQTSSTDIVKTINLYRMLVKVDIEVQRTPDTQNPTLYPGISESHFKLTYVSLHNYNTTGRLIPDITPDAGTWTNSGGGVAFRTSLPVNPRSISGWQNGNRLEWNQESDFTTANTALEGVIYTFEANTGTDNSNRPCIIIGGQYGGSNEITYYRADFLDNNKNYLSLLRNHKYKLIIRKIGGKGSSSVEEAYLAGPVNIETEVIEWNEGGYLDGVWDDAHEIRFSDRGIHFSQFGTTDVETIKLRTNIPTLTFENFSDVTSGPDDNDWKKTESDEWTNDHFTVTAQNTASMGEYFEYTITIKAKKTKENDPSRKSVFYVKGHTLQAAIEISQDNHSKYNLLSLPNPVTPISIDGTAQRIKLTVESTHPYRIDYIDSDAMFDGVYTTATGGTKINQTNIPITTAELYLSVKAHSLPDLRVGKFYIKHLDGGSDAPARIYSVIQQMPNISAELAEGGLSGKVSTDGGQKTIKVTSNLAGWYPILYIDNVRYTGDLSNYFNIVNGSKNQDVIFTIPAMPQVVTVDRVFKIKFMDINAMAVTERDIIITQGITTIPPNSGTKAPEWILAVDEDGVLNLDGRGYIVYFKLGSTIAISGTETNFSSSQIAWAPEEYDISKIRNDWTKVPFGDVSSNRPERGTGDPCSYASKNGTVGGYVMATESTYKQEAGALNWVTQMVQGVPLEGHEAGGIFYPTVGALNSTNGGYYYSYTSGNYWSSGTIRLPSHDPYGGMQYVTFGVNLNFNYNYSKVSTSFLEPASGLAVRCIPSGQQSIPFITAELAKGGFSTKVSREGGQETIKVSSNLSSWVPVLFIDGVQYTGNLSSYFNIQYGINSQSIVFTVPAIPQGVIKDRIFTIRFKNSSNTIETESDIVITQKGLNATAPAGGVKAPEWILAVDDKGKLNLDGKGHIVYFKWGSTIAISGSETNFSSSQIAWTPNEYDISEIGDDWSKIPDVKTYSPIPNNQPILGLGDPCSYASKDGIVGKYKMATDSEYSKENRINWTTELVQGEVVTGHRGVDMFYPAAGHFVGGNFYQKGNNADYFVYENVYGGPYFFRATQGTIFLTEYLYADMAFPIRCIPDDSQQVPTITAELEDEEFSSIVPSVGAQKAIRVSSNLTGWYPMLFVDNIQYTGDLSSYFSIVNGAGSKDVIFTIPAIPQGALKDRVFKIKFVDVNAQTITKYDILITQRCVDATPPTSGVKAPEWILAVDENGVLNLDGRGHIVYFKWGSTIAISGSEADFSSSQVAWTPKEYSISEIREDWTKVPYGNTSSNQPEKGMGDPCSYASKNGSVGGYIMATESTYKQDAEIFNWITQIVQGEPVEGFKAGSVFYPATGMRYSTNGGYSPNYISGSYWSSSTMRLPSMDPSGGMQYITLGTILNFNYNYSKVSISAWDLTSGLPVRCIPK